jgi:transcriptional regulator of arginine metabolism
MKTQRHAAILRLVREHQVHSQEQLRELLHAEGVDVTQATLSRDMHELKLVKLADPAGGSQYALPPAGEVLRPSLAQMLSTLLVGVDGVGNLLIVRTPAGSANALAIAIDQQDWEEIVGTVAGDDTILVVVRTEAARRTLAKRLEDLAGK